MKTFPICNIAQDHVAYSVVELNGVNHILAAALPQGGVTLREQTQSAIEAVSGVLQKFDADESLLHLTVFLADPTQTTACRQVVRSLLGKNVPATSYVPQPPCTGALVAVEVLALGRGREKVQIERVSDQLLLTRQDGRTWIYAEQAVPLTSAPGVYEKTICSYQHLRRLLLQGGARLDQVLRTWLYLGGIVDDDGPVQRYKELNRARADVYEGVSFLTEQLPDDRDGPVFPASTGIGTNGRGITISAVALTSDQDDVVAVPLENPRQTSAFAYSKGYSPQSPKFSRGMAVVQGSDTTLFISGTASITNSETRHLGDVAAQMHESLENIIALISEENLARHGLPGQGTTLEGLAVARVYVKHREDYPAVRQVCEQRLPGVPLTYVVADVCRTNLLVEIEGIAFSHGRGGHDGKAPVRVRRCAASRKERPTRAECHHLCPDGCPERDICPHAVLH
jgi:enamine deaminase RidA (YjgF/YER057c/UK114 family)